LSFAKERIGPLAAIITTVFYLLALYLFALLNTPENPFAIIYSETLIKTTCQHLLLLVGFDTLIYQKYYDTPPILVGHHPPGVIEAIDKRRSAFFWTGEETCSGGDCKVAWTVVCSPKNLGGLGVLSIPHQNSALLSKFLSKFHSDSNAPWACWFRCRYGWTLSRDLGDSHALDTSVWKGIAANLSTFRSLTCVSIGDG
jgi:hypothetical protein